ncbi:MAG: type II secretion system protein GspD [Gammaproteobacteria bacterium]
MNIICSVKLRSGLLAVVLALSPSIGSISVAQTVEDGPNLISVSMRDVQLAEIMEMLSMQNRANILLADGVEGEVTVNLYDVEVDEAIESIANAAGYIIERRAGSYFVVEPNDAGQYGDSGFTVVRAFNVQYTDADLVGESLSPYLSEFGTVTALPESKMVVIEDQPAFMMRMSRLLRELDRRPQQILIEAKILEITLADEDAYGIDWQKFFQGESGTGDGNFGTRGLSGPGSSASSGFFFEYLTPDYEVRLDALEIRGRLRTLSTPKLLALEHEEASVIIGDRRGYQVTTTINQVTSQTIEFLESGVILRVTPSVDQDGQIMLEIHPEVSNGTVDSNGIPSQTTTELTTRLLVPNAQTVFLGGLIKHAATQDQQRVPVLGRLPGLRRLFSNRQEININTETIVLITPRIVDAEVAELAEAQSDFVEVVGQELDIEAVRIETDVVDVFGPPYEPEESDGDQD